MGAYRVHDTAALFHGNVKSSENLLAMLPVAFFIFIGSPSRQHREEWGVHPISNETVPTPGLKVSVQKNIQCSAQKVANASMYASSHSEQNELMRDTTTMECLLSKEYRSARRSDWEQQETEEQRQEKKRPTQSERVLM